MQRLGYFGLLWLYVRKINLDLMGLERGIGELVRD